MAWRIVKQPNGLFARFSDIVDNFTHYDMTEAKAIYLCEDVLGRQAAREKVARAIRDEDPWTDKPRPGDGLCRFRDSLETIELIHGKEEAEMRRKLLSRKTCGVGGGQG